MATAIINISYYKIKDLEKMDFKISGRFVTLEKSSILDNSVLSDRVDMDCRALYSNPHLIAELVR